MTGDWHFEVSIFGYPERLYAPLDGPNALVDITRSMGSRGVHEMSRLIGDCGIKPYDGVVKPASAGKPQKIDGRTAATPRL